MTPNPVLKKLGFSDTDRLVIIHMDDVGMCHASLTAYQELMEYGLVSSAAVMVPCPWFPATADYLRQHPRLDMGVHITLTSEWDTYRWGPISTADPYSGMIDSEGYFYRSAQEARENGHLAAVRIEILMQIQRALAAGIDVTHIDTHMGTAFYHKYLPLYVEAAQSNGLAIFLLRYAAERMGFVQVGKSTIEVGSALIVRLEAEGYPMVDEVDDMPLGAALEFEDRLELTKTKMKALKPGGITHFLMHAAHDTPELRAIAPDWRARVGDLQVFQSDELRKFIQNDGIQVIGYRALRETIGQA